MGHAPHILAPWSQLEHTFFQQSLLPQALLEQVRRTLAVGHGCEYCQAKGGPPSQQHDEIRTSLAVGLAQVYASDPRGIDRSMLTMMREHFSDPELVELIAFIGFMWAGGAFGRTFGIRPQA